MQADPTATAATPDRRQYPRWTTAGLESALGRVTDLSLSGMRIRKTGNPGLREGDRFRLEVRHEQSVFLLPAQLASIRPHAGAEAGGMVDLGVRFPDLTKAQKRSVKKILTASGFPDGGGEIVFQGMPAEEDLPEDPEMGDLLDDEDASEASFSPAPPPAPAGTLRSWSQLTEAADAPKRPEPEASSEPPAPPPAAGTPEQPDGSISEDEEAEIAALRRAAGEVDELREQAAAAAAPVQPGPDPPDDAETPRGEPGNQRKNGRLAAQDAHTALGEVLDISASGMRIRRRGTRPVEVGAAFLLDLYVCGRAVRLPVEVMRIQKAGWRTHEYGLKFGELPPDMRAQFGQIARMAAKHVSIA